MSSGGPGNGESIGSSSRGRLSVALTAVISMETEGALPVIVSTPFIMPMVPGGGATLTVMVVEPWGTSGPLLAAENVKAGLVLVIRVRRSGAVPEFDTVRVCIVAGPGCTVPKSREVGDTLIAGSGGGGASLMVNAPLFVAFCPSGFATVTSLGPVPAMIAMPENLAQLQSFSLSAL